MDCFGVPRAGLADALDRAVATAQKRAKDRDSGQMSLMGMAGMDMPSLPGTGLPQDGPPVPEWADDELLRQEKEALGFFLSSHPLLTFRHEILRMKLVDLQDAADYPGGAQLRTAVIVTGVKEIITKKGGKMAFLEIEDLVGGGECAVFPDSWAEMREVFTSDQPLLLEARVSDREGPGEEGGPKRARLVAEKVQPLADARDPGPGRGPARRARHGPAQGRPGALPRQDRGPDVGPHRGVRMSAGPWPALPGHALPGVLEGDRGPVGKARGP
jgi:DNA polymerase-3 subunit alpha